MSSAVAELRTKTQLATSHHKASFFAIETSGLFQQASEPSYMWHIHALEILDCRRRFFFWICLRQMSAIIYHR